jgi:hypothetical protein
VLLSVVVDKDPPFAFVVFDFDGHWGCLLLVKAGEFSPSSCVGVIAFTS